MTKRRSAADALASLAATLPDAKNLPQVPALEQVRREAAPPAAEPAAKDEAPGKGAALKQLTLYLNPEAHKALNQLALDLDRRPHSLLIEALNDLMTKYGRAAVAIDRRTKATRG